jgi:hypothetical protein
MNTPTDMTIKYWLNWFASFAENKLTPRRRDEALSVLNLVDCAPEDKAEVARLQARPDEVPRLRAAASELLSACVEAEDWLTHHGGDPDEDPGLDGLLRMLSAAIVSANRGRVVEQIHDPND